MCSTTKRSRHVSIGASGKLWESRQAGVALGPGRARLQRMLILQVAQQCCCTICKESMEQRKKIQGSFLKLELFSRRAPDYSPQQQFQQHPTNHLKTRSQEKNWLESAPMKIVEYIHPWCFECFNDFQPSWIVTSETMASG